MGELNTLLESLGPTMEHCLSQGSACKTSVISNLPHKCHVYCQHWEKYLFLKMILFALAKISQKQISGFNALQAMKFLQAKA